MVLTRGGGADANRCFSPDFWPDYPGIGTLAGASMGTDADYHYLQCIDSQRHHDHYFMEGYSVYHGHPGGIRAPVAIRSHPGNIDRLDQRKSVPLVILK